MIICNVSFSHAQSIANAGRKTGRTAEDFTPEWKAKISAAAKERNTGTGNPMFGKTHSTETRAKLSATRKSKAGTPGWNVRPPCSDEKAQKIKLANRGKRWVHNKATRERKYFEVPPYQASKAMVVTDKEATGFEFGIELMLLD